MSGSTPGSQSLVLGLDAGGTWTRAVLAGADGRRIGQARAAGANPGVHGAELAAGRLGAAISDALRGCDPARVAGCVIGLAGASQYAADPAIARRFQQTWTGAGLRCPVQVVSDVAVAFAAGTEAPAGSVLLAGTGAVAAQIRDRSPAGLHGGYGWLLGDDGSGFWIGRQAVRVALSALDGGAAASPLSELVLDWYQNNSGADPTAPATPGAGTPWRPVAALIREVHRQPAISLAALAPLVMRAHAQGDPAAGQILREAADALIGTLAGAREEADGTPVVLAGGLLSGATALRDLVRAGVRARWPQAPVCTATDGAAAAAWLAALPLLPTGADAGDLRARLLPPESAVVAP